MERKFIIADNQDITRIGLESMICKDVLRAENQSELLGLLREYPDGVVIVDYSLFDFYSTSQMINLKASVPLSSWLLFSEEFNSGFIRDILLVDDSFSVVMKSDKEEVISEALERLTRNEIYLCSYALELLNVLPSSKEQEALTKAEKNVLRQIAAGKSTKEIAAVMNLSFHTINTHRRNIFRKIGVNNVQEAVKYAIRSGIVDPIEYYI